MADASGAAAAVQGATTETVASVDAKVAGKVDNTTTVNGHALSSNVTLTAADVGADASGAAAAVQGATTETVASVDAKVAGKVDNTTTVNGHALSSNVTLTAADVGAADIDLSNLSTAGTAVITDAVTAGIAALDATVTQTAGTDGLALSITQTDGVITAISGSIAPGTYASLSGNNTFAGNNTFNGTNTYTGANTFQNGISITGGTLSAGSVAATLGATTVNSLTTSGAVQAATLTTSGAATVGGALSANSLDVTNNATVGGALTVTGMTTATGGVTTGEVILNGTSLTAADKGTAAITSGSATTIATTATVLKSAENAEYTGTTVKGAAATTDTISEAIDTTTSALNNVLIADGSKVDDAKVYVEWNGSDSNLATVLGDGAYTSTKNIAAGDSVTAALSKVDTAIGDRSSYTSEYNITKADAVAKSLNDLDTAIGDRSAMASNAGADYTTALAGKDIASAITQVASNIGAATSAAKGNIASGATVNANLDTLDAAIGDRTAFSVGAGVDYTTTGLNNKDMVNAVSQVASNIGGATTAANGNIASTATVNANLDSLDAAIGNRTYTNGYNVNSNENVTTSIDNLDTVVGDFANVANANGNIGADVATSLDNMDAAIGDRHYASTKYISDGDDLTTAVGTLDANIARVDHDLSKLKHQFNSGMASMAAMTALVPNSRSQGNTSLSLGTGAYNGHTAMAIGGFHYLTDNILLNAGASWGNSNDMAYRLGVTWSF